VHDKSADGVGYALSLHIGESTADRRERMARLQTEALERRQQLLRDQSSPLNTPAARIKLWENLHQLELPRNPEHRLIAVIAENTSLSLEEVRAEQRLRVEAPSASLAVEPLL
jgi:hypothetical protein